MSRKGKIWLIIAASLILVGCIIFGGVMTVLKWDFTKLSTAKYETNRYEIAEDYKNISVVTDTADIVFAASENNEATVECIEQKNIKHSVAVKDGTLVIESVDTRKWYDYIGIIFGNTRIKVNIPKGEYGSLSVGASTGDVEIPKDFKFESIDISVSTGDVSNHASALEHINIKTSTGDIHTQDVTANSLDLTVSTGDIKASSITSEGDIKINVSTGDAKLYDITCKNVISSGSTGDISLNNVIAKEKLSIKRNTGDVKLEGCDAGELFIKTTTGRVKGSLLSDKVFVTKTDTGRVNVPKTVSGGKCEITTDTGDIDIKIK